MGTQELIIILVVVAFVIASIALPFYLRKTHPDKLWLGIVLCLLIPGMGQFYLPGGLIYFIGLLVIFLVLRQSVGGGYEWVITTIISIGIMYYRFSLGTIHKVNKDENKFKQENNDDSKAEKPEEHEPVDAMLKYYEILSLKRDATPEKAKEAYRDLIKVWHPDRFSNDPRLQEKADEKLKEIVDAHERIQIYLKDWQFFKTESEQSTEAKKSSQSDTGESEEREHSNAQSQPEPPDDIKPASLDKQLREKIIITVGVILCGLLFTGGYYAIRQSSEVPKPEAPSPTPVPTVSTPMSYPTPEKSNWNLYEEFDDVKLYYDKNNVTRENGKIKVWRRAMLKDEGRDRFRKLSILARASEVTHLGDLMEINCRGRVSRSLNTIFYGKNDNIIWSGSVEDKWKDIEDIDHGSDTDSLYRIMCQKEKKQVREKKTITKPSSTNMNKWTDENGNVHYSGTIGD